MDEDIVSQSEAEGGTEEGKEKEWTTHVDREIRPPKKLVKKREELFAIDVACI